MKNQIKSYIEIEQWNGGLQSVFKEAIFPNINNDISKLLKFSALLIKWETGTTFQENDYFTYGLDEKGYPKVYVVLTTHKAQENIKPDGENSEYLYKLLGYINNIRVWSEPFGKKSSYNLDEVVPHFITSEHNATTYTQGATVYKDNYIITPDNLVYKVIPNQIVMNITVVPFTNSDIYEYVENAIILDSQTIKISETIWFKSLTDDNRFEPTLDSVVWEEVAVN